jgi:hypothetical protein
MENLSSEPKEVDHLKIHINGASVSTIIVDNHIWRILYDYDQGIAACFSESMVSGT